MEKTTLTLLAGLSSLALQGCVTPDNWTTEMAEPTGLMTVSGQLSYRQRIALSPNAIVEVELFDISRADAPAELIAGERYPLDGKQVPLPFSISFAPSSLSAHGRYAVRGTIRGADGRLLWITDTAYIVTARSGSQDLGMLNLVQAVTSTPALTQREWGVEDISGKGIIDNSRLTVNFGDNGRIHGSSGCNFYTGSYTLTDMNLSIGSIASTRKACASALMNQEQDFLKVIGGLNGYSMDPKGRLILSGKNGEYLTAI